MRNARDSIRGGLLIVIMIVIANPVFGQSAGGAQVVQAELAEEPRGYRMGNYRAPVPATLQGGSVVSTEQTRALMETGEVILIDVLPRHPKPKNMSAGTIWRLRLRKNIPGSVWLANTGYGALAQPMERYFRDNLARLTREDKTRALLFYCQANCWMSWNAAKRAISYGYTRVYWYPQGTDGWAAAGLPTQECEPVPPPDGF